MRIEKHGISIGIERSGNQFYLSFKVLGKLTHEDYQQITPFIDSALANVEDPKINAFIDCSELEGWELRAAWDDFKLGLKHGREFAKVAIYLGEDDDKKWLEYGSKVAGWFIAGKCESFRDEAQALAWLNE